MRTLVYAPGLLVLVFACAACGPEPGPVVEPAQGPTPAVERLWETEPVFSVPESTLYDPQSDVIYVANIVGDPTAQDGDGYIARLGLDGTVLELRWVEGLDAPKGMGIRGGRLFVSNIVELVEIDIEAGEIVARYPAEGAQFLNDVAISPAGEVFVSDMQTSKIHVLRGGALEEFATSEDWPKLNGLFAEPGRLLAGTRNAVWALDYGDASAEKLFDVTKPVDGLAGDGAGGYVFGDWFGHVTWVSPEHQSVEVLDLQSEGKNAADIDYVPARQLLLVPTFKANTVAAYRMTIPAP